MVTNSTAYSEPNPIHHYRFYLRITLNFLSHFSPHVSLSLSLSLSYIEYFTVYIIVSWQQYSISRQTVSECVSVSLIRFVTQSLSDFRSPAIQQTTHKQRQYLLRSLLSLSLSLSLSLFVCLCLLLNLSFGFRYHLKERLSLLLHSHSLSHGLYSFLFLTLITAFVAPLHLFLCYRKIYGFILLRTNY